MQGAKRGVRSRRRHSAELKGRIVAECESGERSVAQVAQAHGVNANLVHRWRREAETKTGAVVRSQDVFVPVALRSAMPDGSDIRVELRRGALAVKVQWPLEAAGSCAAWLRELLR
jgi:transposase